jgi:hypothetical protein
VVEIHTACHYDAFIKDVSAKEDDRIYLAVVGELLEGITLSDKKTKITRKTERKRISRLIQTNHGNVLILNVCQICLNF